MLTKPREWIYLPRHKDLARLFEAVRDLDPLSVVGVSNLGKSATLRALCDAQVQSQHLGSEAGDFLFVYIDFNARASGLTPAELAGVPRRFCVVADPSRARAIVGALRAGTTTDLVIDEGTAHAVLDRL